MALLHSLRLQIVWCVPLPLNVCYVCAITAYVSVCASSSWVLFFPSFLASFFYNKFIVDAARSPYYPQSISNTFPFHRKIYRNKTNRTQISKHVLANFKTVSELFCFFFFSFSSSSSSSLSFEVVALATADVVVAAKKLPKKNWKSLRLANKTNYDLCVNKYRRPESSTHGAKLMVAYSRLTRALR